MAGRIIYMGHAQHRETTADGGKEGSQASLKDDSTRVSMEEQGHTYQSAMTRMRRGTRRRTRREEITHLNRHLSQ